MKISRTELEGVLIVQPEVFVDERGYFLETWNKKSLRELGMEADFVQDNLSYSRKGVLRGLHFQNPTPQKKLVSVLKGEVYDVVVDIRRGSKSFSKWLGFTLSDKTMRMLFVPEGFAHGFVVRSEIALVQYKCSDFYTPCDEMGLAWNDPDSGIDWGLNGIEPILSEKDKALKPLKSIPRERLFP